MSEEKLISDQSQIPTNLRLLYLLEVVARHGRPSSPVALGEELGLPKPTVHRLLATAEAEGFLQRDVDGRSYGAGPRLRRISINTLSSERLRSERMRILRDLAEEVGETCNLAAPGREGMVYLDRVETHWPLRIQLPVGTQVPFYCTASGKMYLSSLRPEKLDRLLSMTPREPRTDHTITDANALKDELDITRRRGYATDNGEFMDDMTAIAVAVCDDQGRLLTTLSIHAPTPRSTLDKIISYHDRLRAAADQLEEIARE